LNPTTPFIPAAGRPRRLHSAEFKARLVDECGHPGVSLSGIALANGINANLLRRCRNGSAIAAIAARAPGLAGPSGGVTSFVPLHFEPEPCPVPVPASAPDIRIEVQRSAGTVTVSWPTSAAAECAGWLREVLR